MKYYFMIEKMWKIKILRLLWISDEWWMKVMVVRIQLVNRFINHNQLLQNKFKNGRLY